MLEFGIKSIMIIPLLNKSSQVIDLIVIVSFPKIGFLAGL